MKVELKADERDGCVATITGCGVGGHTATFRFGAPDYQPDPLQFDGDEVSFCRPVLHGSVICTVVDDDAGEMRATLEGFSPDSDEPRRHARKAKGFSPDSDEPRRHARKAKDEKPDHRPPRGAVTADEDGE